MASDPKSYPQSTGMMPVWLKGKLSKINDNNDINVYGSSPPSNSCFADFVKPPTAKLRHQLSAPDLTKYDTYGACPSGNNSLPRSAHVTPLTSPESSPSLQRKNKGGHFSDSECDMPTRRNWRLPGFFPATSSIVPDSIKRQALVQISEDENYQKPSDVIIPIPRQMDRRRKKKSTITKFEINALAPTSM